MVCFGQVTRLWLCYKVSRHLTVTDILVLRLQERSNWKKHNLTFKTIVGVMDDNGRFPGSMKFAGAGGGWPE